MTMTMPDPDKFATTKFVRATDDRKLMQRMGVPDRLIGGADRYLDEPLPPQVQNWLKKMPMIYRPSFDTMKASDQDLPGVGLVFYGPAGTHKSVTAVRTLLAAVRLGVPDFDPNNPLRRGWAGWALGHFQDWQELSALMRVGKVEDEWRMEELDGLLKAGLIGETQGGQFLVIDDLSRERPTDFNLDRLSFYLRYRYERCIPTILTTNLEPDKWEDVYGSVLGQFLTRSTVQVAFSR